MSYGDYGLRPRPCCKWVYRGSGKNMRKVCVKLCKGSKVAGPGGHSSAGQTLDYGAIGMPEHRGLIAMGMLVAGATIGHVVGLRFGKTDPATYALMGAMLGGAYGLRSYMAADIYRQKLEG